MAALLRRVLNLRLCPKADLCNISEFSPVKALFLAGNEKNGWSPLVMSSTYLVARGIRGREGVQVLYDFCSARSFQVDWQDDDFVECFVTFFEERWEAAVVRSQEVSALSHQEGRHAGLSGMNFVETLKDTRHRQVLFQDVAVRLACFFDDSKDMSASTLMDFYHALVSHPFAPTTDSYEVHHHGCRLLHKKPKVEHDAVKAITPMVRDGTYNSMDFLRRFYNIMQLFKAPSVSFTTPLWIKMMRCQGKSDVDYFGLTMEDANMLIPVRKKGAEGDVVIEGQKAVGEQSLYWRWLIIDEFGMVGSSLLAEVDMKLRDVVVDVNPHKKTHSGHVRPFGGLNVLLSGDLWQLPPPSGGYLGNIPAEFIANARTYNPSATISHGQSLLWGGPQ